MGTNRPAKFAGTLKKRISEIIQVELKDPRVGFVTITEVKVSQDLRHVKVYFSIFGNEKEKKSAVIGLRHATGFVRKRIAESVKVRFVPEIVFEYDEAYEHQRRIDELIERIKKEDEQRAKGSNEGVTEI
jgi:ribosome-binding factor A